MKKPIGFFMLATALATSAYAQSNNTTVLPFQELTAGMQVGPLKLQADGLPVNGTPTYIAWGPAPSVQMAFSLAPAQGDPFAQSNPSSGFALIPAWYWIYWTIGSWPRFVVAELLDTQAPPGSTLLVGITDNNGSGYAPNRNGLLCQAQVVAGAAARCFIDLQGKPPPDFYLDSGVVNYWALVQAPAGAGTQKYSLNLNVAVLYQGVMTATGPGHIDSGVSEPLRLSMQAPLFATQRDLVEGSGYTGPRYFAAVTVATGPNTPNTPDQAVLPFALTRQDASIDVPLSFGVYPWTQSVNLSQGNLPTQQGTFGLEAGQTLRKLYFDVPPVTDGSEYAPVTIQVGGSLSNTTLDVYAIRTDFPAQSSSPDIASAPDADSSAVHWNLSSHSLTFTPKAGRWYIVMSSMDSRPMQIDLSIAASNQAGPRFGAGANPTIHPGVYYNVQRSGHGVTISQAGGQQMLYWFTYLEDGTPTWYVAQAAAPDPNSGWWQAPLSRVSWSGSKAKLTQVGSVNVTPIAQNRFTFNWNLEGQYGSEVLAQIARFGDCPALNGATTNLNGAWYAPTLSGYGMDVLALPEQQFNVFYFYDGLGLARWGVGGTGSFAPNSAQEFNQISGFCPSCAYVKTQSQFLGTANVSYTNGSTGHLSTNFVLKSPLSGAWNTDQTMQRLTGSPACTQ